MLEETAEFDKGLRNALENNYKHLVMKPSLLTPERVKQVHDAGLTLVTFGGKSRLGCKQLIELNPDVVHVNNVQAMRDLLDS